MNNILVFLIFFIYSSALCQELQHVFENEEVTLLNPKEANTYYFSLLPSTITTFILTLYDKEIQTSYDPQFSLGYKINNLLKANKVSDAAFWGSFNISQYEDALFERAIKEDLTCARLFLARGKGPTYYQSKRGCYSLVELALFAKRPTVARMFIEAGADPNYKKGQYNHYPICEAAKNNFPECVRLLLEKGANKGLDEALEWGAHNNSVEIVELLLVAGTKPSQTVLERAARNQNDVMVYNYFCNMEQKLTQKAIGFKILL